MNTSNFSYGIMCLL